MHEQSSDGSKEFKHYWNAIHCCIWSNMSHVDGNSPLLFCRLEKKEEELFRAGPLAVLTTSVQSNSQVNTVILFRLEDPAVELSGGEALHG